MFAHFMADKIQINRGSNYKGLHEYYLNIVGGSLLSSSDLKSEMLKKVITDWESKTEFTRPIDNEVLEKYGINSKLPGRKHHIIVDSETKLQVKAIVKSSKIIKSQSKLAAFALAKAVELGLCDKYIKEVTS